MKHAKLTQSLVALMLVAAGGLAQAGGGENGFQPNGWGQNGKSFNGKNLNGWGQNGRNLNGMGTNGKSFNAISTNGRNLNGMGTNGLRGNDAARSSDFMTVDSPVRSTVHGGSTRPAPALSAERIAE